MIDIAVIGRGSVGACAIMEFVKDKNFNVTCFYDPSIAHVSVGESATHLVSNLLKSSCGIDVEKDGKKYDMAVRRSTKYNWKKINVQEFDVNYSATNVHINSSVFSDIVLEKCKKLYRNFNIVESAVLNVQKNENDKVEIVTKNNKYEFDYVIDCGGTPKGEDYEENYNSVELETVNSVIVYDDLPVEEDYTTAEAHDHGWMFGVSLPSRKTYGYLYNNEYLSKEEALENFKKIRNVDMSNVRSFSWNHYYRIKMFENNILYLGNKLYFFEPHQAMPLHFYCDVLSRLHTLLSDTNHTLCDSEQMEIKRKMNSFYDKNITEIMDMICINYVGENKNQTQFWLDMKKQCLEILKSSPGFVTWCKNSERNEYSFYCMFNATFMKTYIKGYKIDLKEFL